ncbi:CGNR zinc finger domain-containing protein [Kitasatospora viridis]|uniref:Putative RNA-binding Zn ribbon-like protein n=1 Tax=Kitasatospora viridis TaxID=281105 RepID=A0A561UBM1_9ACTN|nr:CGNR zinc finger domain-containing protein [Kitasatospora viridis]TWF96763.1 putative RNA-binding Zn ribbon-like protein [Kitasatospora viridis]
MTEAEAAAPDAPQPPADPRPLPGEPLCLDLLNTRWHDGGNPRDLLDSLDGLALWLRLNGFAEQVPADRAALDALLTTRAAIAGHLAQLRAQSAPEEGPGAEHPDLEAARPDLEAARAELNAVLAHGALRRTLAADGPAERAEADTPAWLPAWLAAADYLRLLTEAPDRIRSCAHPDCVLHFYDTSKNGTRRWHSMATCGNRAKASRHYARSKA